MPVDLHRLGTPCSKPPIPPSAAVARAAVSRAARGLGVERVLRDLSAAAPGAARRRPPGAGAAGAGGERTSTRPLRPTCKDQGYATRTAGSSAPTTGRGPAPRTGCRSGWPSSRSSHGRKVSLIGWSLGGVFAREMARRAPDAGALGDHARQPVRRRAARRAMPGSCTSGPAIAGRGLARRERMRRRLRCPRRAIFSRSDGIVAWQGCLEREGPPSENIEVEGSHCGLGHNPAVLYAVADRLASPKGAGGRSSAAGSGA